MEKNAGIVQSAIGMTISSVGGSQNSNDHFVERTGGVVNAARTMGMSTDKNKKSGTPGPEQAGVNNHFGAALGIKQGGRKLPHPIILRTHIVDRTNSGTKRL